MTGNLDEFLDNIIRTSLPGLIGENEDDVNLEITIGLLEFDPNASDAMAGEPKPDDRVDTFPFSIATPEGPYTLSQMPYIGPVRIYLTTDDNDRMPLKQEEIIWDTENPQIFRLELRANRELDAVTGLRVLYGVTSIFTKIKATQNIYVNLSSTNASKLEQAEALAVSVILLNREAIIKNSSVLYEESSYGANIEIEKIQLISSENINDNTRRLNINAKINMKAVRAISETEGIPIESIRSPGTTIDPGRPINIRIDVES